jgi:hypothetical protein
MDAIKTTKEINDFVNLNDTISTISIGSQNSGYSSVSYGAVPTLTTTDLSSLTLGNITVSSPSTTGTTYTLGSGIGLTGANAVWTTHTAHPSVVGGVWNNSGTTIDQGGKLALRGEKADVDINGKSLVKWMEAMEERMNWMQPNVELEKEWDDLKKLGDRYRKLEQKCKEKAEVWKKLKSMPKPEIE